MKRFLFILLISMVFPVLGAEAMDRLVFDDANVLSQEEKSDLESRLLKFKKDFQTEVILVLKNDEVKKEGNEFAASVASKNNLDPNTIVIFADTYYHTYGFYVRGSLKNKFPQWIIEKIQDNNLKVNFREKKYYTGLSEAVTNVIGISSGKITPDDLKKDSSNYIILLICILAFFIIVFPLIQFREMKRSHFSSKPIDLVSSVLLINTFGTRGKNLFDNFSKGKGTFASKSTDMLASGGGGAAGYW